MKLKTKTWRRGVKKNLNAALTRLSLIIKEIVEDLERKRRKKTKRIGKLIKGTSSSW